MITPRWVPGLSITVDYYRIRVQNLIAVLWAQTILNQCVDLPSINNQFCQLIFARQTVDNPATVENDIGALQNPALISAGVNFARQKADGIDIEVSYRRTFENGHRLNIRGLATYVIRRDNYVDPLNPGIQNRQLSELGDPQWSANLSLSYGMGPVDFRYTMNYIGPQVIGTYEQYFQIPAIPTTPRPTSMPMPSCGIRTCSIMRRASATASTNASSSTRRGQHLRHAAAARRVRQRRKAIRSIRSAATSTPARRSPPPAPPPPPPSLFSPPPPPPLDLRQRLVGEAGAHHEARMAGGVAEIHQAALGRGR